MRVRVPPGALFSHDLLLAMVGGVAQMVERMLSMHEAQGSIPCSSTFFCHYLIIFFYLIIFYYFLILFFIIFFIFLFFFFIIFIIFFYYFYLSLFFLMIIIFTSKQKNKKAKKTKKKNPPSRSRTSDLEISIACSYSLPLYQLSYKRICFSCQKK